MEVFICDGVPLVQRMYLQELMVCPPAQHHSSSELVQRLMEMLAVSVTIV